jgi:anti-sigma factor RsiW
MAIEIEELEDLLSNMRFVHLTSEELDDHVFGKLDELDDHRITAHLDMCQVCQRRLEAMCRDYGVALPGSGAG